MQHRLVQGSTHRPVEERPSGGTSDGCGGPGADSAHDGVCEGVNDSAPAGIGDAYGGANGSCCVQGVDGAHGEASRGARVGCEEGKSGRKMGAHGDGGTRGGACGGTNGGCSGQGVSGVRNGARRGACAGFEEGKAYQRVGLCGSRGASGCNGSHDALTGGGGGSIKGGDGRSQGDQSDAGDS
jgi:hypothetical protein